MDQGLLVGSRGIPGLQQQVMTEVWAPLLGLLCLQQDCSLGLVLG